MVFGIQVNGTIATPEKRNSFHRKIHLLMNFSLGWFLELEGKGKSGVESDYLQTY